MVREWPPKLEVLSASSPSLRITGWTIELYLRRCRSNLAFSIEAHAQALIVTRDLDAPPNVCEVVRSLSQISFIVY